MRSWSGGIAVRIFGGSVRLRKRCFLWRQRGEEGEEKEREGVAEGSCRGKKSAARQIRMICLKSYEKTERPRLPERQFRGRSVFYLADEILFNPCGGEQGKLVFGGEGGNQGVFRCSDSGENFRFLSGGQDGGKLLGLEEIGISGIEEVFFLQVPFATENGDHRSAGNGSCGSHPI